MVHGPDDLFLELEREPGQVSGWLHKKDFNPHAPVHARLVHFLFLLDTFADETEMMEFWFEMNWIPKERIEWLPEECSFKIHWEDGHSSQYWCHRFFGWSEIKKLWTEWNEANTPPWGASWLTGYERIAPSMSVTSARELASGFEAWFATKSSS